MTQPSRWAQDGAHRPYCRPLESGSLAKDYELSTEFGNLQEIVSQKGTR
jgi:hypothetical protein